MDRESIEHQHDSANLRASEVDTRVVIRWFNESAMAYYDEDHIEEKWIVVTDGGMVRPTIGEIVGVDFVAEDYDAVGYHQPNVKFVVGTIVTREERANDSVYTIQLDSGIVVTLRRYMNIDEILENTNRKSRFERVREGEDKCGSVSRKRRFSPSAEDGEPCIKQHDESTESSEFNYTEETANVSKKRKIQSPSDDNLPDSKRYKETESATESAAAPIEDTAETGEEVTNLDTEQQKNASNDIAIKDDSLYGPPPPKDSHIFKGQTVIVSLPQLKPNENNACICRGQLTERITAGGGTLITEMPATFTDNLFLVSNSYTRTRNYIKALSLGLPCVSYEWIVDSCRENTLLSYKKYLLPAGKTLAGQVIKWHGKEGIFKGCVAMVMSAPGTDNYNFWCDVLGGAGAVTVNQVQSPTGPKVFLVMAERSYLRQHVVLLRGLQVNLRTTDWVVECLIKGKLVQRAKRAEFTARAFE